jgi:lariat debranching enzyme
MSGRPLPLLSYDPEWLSITRAFHSYLSLTRQQSRFPEESQARSLVARAAKWVEKNVKTDEQGEIPVADHQTFVMTAPGPGSEDPAIRQRKRFFLCTVLN